jgi:hypothetical protein
MHDGTVNLLFGQAGGVMGEQEVKRQASLVIKVNFEICQSFA